MSMDEDTNIPPPDDVSDETKLPEISLPTSYSYELERPILTATPAAVTEQNRQSLRLILLSARLLFLVLLVTISLLPFVGAITESTQAFNPSDYIGPFIATLVFGFLVLIVDIYTPNKRLASVFGVYLGIVAGLFAALAMGAMLDLVADSWSLTGSPERAAYLSMVKLAIGLALCYLAVSIVLTTKDNFRLVIPYVEFSKQVRGVRPLLVDSSALIDGRIDLLSQTGFLDAPLIMPQFVLDELQRLADSADRLKRARGRRGLTIVSKLQANPRIDVSIDPTDPTGLSVDHKLLNLASGQNLRVLTTDYNLNKVAQIHNVTVLNINDLANMLKSQVIPGEALMVEVVKAGEERGQGIGYMPDGTMVVVEDASKFVGKMINLTVTNSLQTSAGRMIFGKCNALENIESETTLPQSTTSMAKSATNQPRMISPPSPSGPRRETSEGRRKPRR